MKSKRKVIVIASIFGFSLQIAGQRRELPYVLGQSDEREFGEGEGYQHVPESRVGGIIASLPVFVWILLDSLMTFHISLRFARLGALFVCNRKKYR